MTATNGNPDWLDFEAPAGAQAETASYPTIQWFNGGQGSAHPVMKTGGWELPTKWFGEVIGHVLDIFDIEHQGAENPAGTDPAYLLATLHFAAVAKHISYYVGAGKERRWFTDYQPGRFSRVKLLGFVREIEAINPLTPVIVTFRSSVARDFNAVAKAFRSDVLANADRIAAEMARDAGRNAPDKFLPYAFWLPLGAVGKRVKTGGGSQKSQYAPLEGKWDSAAFQSDDRAKVIAVLKALATPAELRGYVRDSFYDEARQWLENEKAKLAGHVDEQEFTAPEGDDE